jgi:hypothetical protein
MAADFQTILSSPSRAYAEGLEFFRGKGILNDAFKKLAADLEKNGIDYAVIGAIALNQHGFQRFTVDIDLLLTPEGLDAFHEKLVRRGYRPAFAGARKKFRTAGEMCPWTSSPRANIRVTDCRSRSNFQTLIRLLS